MGAHSIWSPSGASRWMRCPSSVYLSSSIEDTESSYAREGTTAHELAELTLKSDTKDAAQFVGRVMSTGIAVTDAMAEYVQSYVDYLLDLIESYRLDGATVTWWTELRVSYSETLGQDDAFGTSDFVLVARYPDGDVLHIADLKYGHNRVYAEENEQMMTYALAVMETLGMWLHKVKAVHMTIHMPREDFVDSWETSPERLLVFASMMRASAASAKEVMEDPTQAEKHLHPGEKQCRWCKAFASCPAAARRASEIAEVDFENLDEAPAPSQRIEPADMATLEKWAAAVDYLTDWCSAVMGEMERRLFRGDASRDWKLAEGRKGSRQFTDEERAKQIVEPVLGEKAYTREFKTPAALEKLMKKTPEWVELQKLIRQADGRPKVVHVSDPRPAITTVPVDFESLD